MIIHLRAATPAFAFVENSQEPFTEWIVQPATFRFLMLIQQCALFKHGTWCVFSYDSLR